MIGQLQGVGLGISHGQVIQLIVKLILLFHDRPEGPGRALQEGLVMPRVSTHQQPVGNAVGGAVLVHQEVIRISYLGIVAQAAQQIIYRCLAVDPVEGRQDNAGRRQAKFRVEGCQAFDLVKKGLLPGRGYPRLELDQHLFGRNF